jgi:DNA-binding NtrC family response regulator
MPKKMAANQSSYPARTQPEPVSEGSRRSIRQPTLNDIHLTRRRELLVADKDPHTHEVCKTIAAQLRCEIVIAPPPAFILEGLDNDQARIVLLDNETLADTLRLLRHIQAQRLSIRVIVCSAKPQLSTVVQVIKAGAVDYLEKPLKISAVKHAFEVAFAVEVQSSPVIPIVDLERQAIENAVIQAHGDKVLAAQLLGIGKTTLYRKLRKYRVSNK